MSSPSDSLPVAGSFLSRELLDRAEKLAQNPQDAVLARSVAEELKALCRLAPAPAVPPPASQKGAGPAEKQAATLVGQLRDPNLGLKGLLTLCRSPARDRVFWADEPAIYRILAEKFLEFGDPILACDVAREGLGHASLAGDLRLRQLLGLALARSGAARRANLVLTELADEGHRDSESLGLLARTHKDLGLKALLPADRSDHFRRAYSLYRATWREHGDPWTGINAATLALMLRNRKEATALADEVQVRCLEQLKAPTAPDGNAAENQGGAPLARYWQLATLGQAALILGRPAEAEKWYAEAAEAGRGRFGSLATTWRDAQLLAEFLNFDLRPFLGRMQLPNVVVFVGHMIDADDRKTPRFPPLLERAVDRAIRDRLTKLNARIGYSSAACGSDILFLEALQDLRAQGSEAHVVLPYDRNLFVQDSVEIRDRGHWRERFDRVLHHAVEVTTASEQRLELGSVSYEFSGLIMQGLAKIKAEQLGTGLKFLAVWDGRPGDGPGGTAHNVNRWRAQGFDVEVIDLAEILSSFGLVVPPPAPAPAVAPAPSTPPPHLGSTVMALLFADVAGFSKLREAEIPHFVTEFLGMVDRLLPLPPRGPLKRNTWGDGLYFAFESVRDAGLFALELCEEVSRTNWAKKNLPPELNLRVGLHAGPVFNCVDPVTKQPNSIGTHVSRTARIEPITPEGEVYASREFAALTAAEGVAEFACSYVGMTSFHKGYGTFPLYHVQRR
jgi:class 3 adenylate cyclase